MFFNIFSTFAVKKSAASKTGPQPGNPAQPTAATRQKKPSAFGRVLKALRSPRFKTQGRQHHYPQANVAYANFPDPEDFDLYDPYTFPDVATSTLPSPTLTDADSSLLPPPPSTISTPTTVYSKYLPGALTPEQSPRPSEDLSKARKRSAVRTPIIIVSPPEKHDTHRSKGINATVNSIVVPPINGLVGKRDSKAEARQLAIGRLVEVLAGHRKEQAPPLDELDRLWDAAEAKTLAKEREEYAKLCVTTRRESTRAGLAVERHSTRERDEDNDSYKGPFSLESPATPSRQRLSAGRRVSSSYDEGSVGERDEDDESYEGPFSLESPETRQRYLAFSSQASRPRPPSYPTQVTGA